MLPFASGYRTLAVGLGTLAVDLGGAVLLTSLIRMRLGWRAWRAVHWLAYVAWPVAFVHALTAGNDLRIWWVALAVWGWAVAVATAVVARLLAGDQARDPWRQAARRAGCLRAGHAGGDTRSCALASSHRAGRRARGRG